MILRDVHADMSGYYKCEVTTSEMYETDEKRQYLLVVRKLFYIFDSRAEHVVISYSSGSGLWQYVSHRLVIGCYCWQFTFLAIWQCNATFLRKEHRKL